MSSRNLPIVVVLALLAFVGCQKKADEANEMPADTAMAAPAPAPAVNPEPVKIDLDEVAKSGIKGEATATHTANDVTVSVVLKDGAKADATYAWHIHTGTCDKGGPVAVDLGNITNLQGSKTVPTSSLPVNEDAFVQVHAPGGKAVACGNLKGHGPDQPAATTTTTM